MKYLLAASFAAIAVAKPQWGPPGHGQGYGYGWTGFPSCVSSCFTSSSCSLGDISCYCNATSVSTANSCIAGTSCSDSDKEGAYQAMAQLCANAGASVTASQEATFSATSGGTAWPTQWTTDSAYAAALSSWKTQTTGAPGPWGGSYGGSWTASNGYGPFGQGGQGNGWGPWASDHSGAWTSGAWTKWWGTGACPPSTWSGWTSGDWTASPAWTAWTACTATTTATNVVTTTYTQSGHLTTATTTSFAIKVDQAAATSTTGNAAMATNYGVAGAAAGVVGLLAGAILL